MTRTLLSLFALAIYGSTLVSSVYAAQAADSPLARRAEHMNLAGKMIRKRGPAYSAAILRRQDEEEELTQTSSSSSATRSATASPSSSTDRGGLLDDLLGGGQQPPPTSSSSSTSSRQTSQSSTSNTSSSSSATTSATSDTRTTGSATSSGTSTRPRQTVTDFVEGSDSEGQSSNNGDEDKDKGGSFLSKPVMLGLGITVAVLVGGAALFTIIRKWKFSPSRHFEDRLEPITWEPTRDTGLPPTGVARGNSLNSHQGSDNQSIRNMVTTGGAQPASMAPDFPPAHDFTAVPNANAGYNDLYRGPSPAPYQANANQYPNPYDGYDHNAGYGGARRY